MRVLLRIIAVWTGVYVLLLSLFVISHAGMIGGPGTLAWFLSLMVLAALGAATVLAGYATVQLWRLRTRGLYAAATFFGLWGAVALVSRLSSQAAPWISIAIPAIVLSVLATPAAREACRRHAERTGSVS